MLSPRKGRVPEAVEGPSARDTYAEIRSVYDKMRQWRHDYHNHLEAMVALAEQGQWEELTRYLRGLRQDFAGLEAHVTTGNALVDAIVSAKMSLARREGIDLAATIVLPYLLPVDDTELCVVLGNLLDNAIEACREVEAGRHIRLDVSFTGGMLHIIVRNKSSGRYAREQGRLRSSKAPDRGAGLPRVEEIVRRHSGYYEYDAGPDSFEVRILVPIEQEQV